MFTSRKRRFHVVNQSEIPIRFFEDERKGSKGIRLTDQLFTLRESAQFANLPHEVEARWRLVETAWEMNIARNLVAVDCDAALETLFASRPGRRVAVTSSRSALNGYQKGRCFYCFADLRIDNAHDPNVDVDHFFPHMLKESGFVRPVDGVWNLVLACQDCNRGEGGKFARVPVISLLERLMRRNDYLISSHHPLRETLVRQTGKTESQRHAFLQQAYDEARSYLIHTWKHRATQLCRVLIMDQTIAYYEANAADYFEQTRDVDMSPLYKRFLPLLPPGGHIFDAGCESGRDTKVFLERGFRVTAIEASARLAGFAANYTGSPVKVLRFDELAYDNEFDGVWACASLLHVPRKELPIVLNRLTVALVPGGVLYASYKRGEGERISGKRLFTDQTETSLTDLVAVVPGIDIVACWKTVERRENRPEEFWINAILRRRGILP